MATFIGTPSDLEDAIAYELHALEYLREALFNESDVCTNSGTVTLGDVGENGRLKLDRIHFLHSDISAGAVQAALSRLRPLAFSAAFKAQDMIVEWILRANGCTEKKDWRFVVKLENYARLSSEGALAEPEFFASRPLISKAFWEIYRHFEPYRGTVIHAGGITIASDCTLQVAKLGKAPLALTSIELAAYIRALCIISKILIGKVSIDAHLGAIIDSAIAELRAYHGISEIQTRYFRRTRLKVIVPPNLITNEAPLTISIDWDELRNLIHDSLMPPGTEGDVFFTATIVVQRDLLVSTWDLPFELIPFGISALTEGDTTFDPHLVHRTHASKSLN